MALVQLSVTIRGVCPILLNSGRLADPTHSITRQIKQITSRKKKTEADHEQLSKLEHLGCLTFDDDGYVILPDLQIEGMLSEGAAKLRLRKVVQAGLRATGHARIIYTGCPKSPEELFADKEHVFRVGCVIERKRVQKTRAIFKEWCARLDLVYDDGLLERQQVLDILAAAGHQCGIGTWRPRFGRFVVEAIS